MTRLICLLLVWALCEGVLANKDDDKDLADPLDFSPIYESGSSGITPLASQPIAAAILKLDKSQYPQLFDSIVSSSIDSIQTRVAPVESAFSAENFGFNPIASKSFHSPQKSAKLVARPVPQQQQPQYQQQAQYQHQAQYQQQPYQQQQLVPVGQQLSPLRYDIRTVHDADYKVYKPDEEEQGEDILSALKKNPSVAAYFKPAVTNVEVAHPLNYRKEELVDNPEVEQNYKQNAYIPGPSRIRRYTGGRQRENLKKSDDDDDEDPYGYKAEYSSRPKAFDSDVYSSAYKQPKDPNKDYEYPYRYDSGYDHKEYDRIKALSEAQAAEIKKNPENCKEVKRDDMTCMVCKDAKTGGNYESCAYVAEPKNNKYAYSKEKKFDSNDEPDEPENDQKEEQPKNLSKYEEAKDSSEKHESHPESKPYANYKNDPKDDDSSSENYKSYYVHTKKPNPSEALRAAENDKSEEHEDTVVKPYNYKKAIPGFYTNNEPKKDVEHVLAEFKKKDRSSCKKVQKNGMTCFQCLDKSGLKHEECMFVSESAPKRSHLAYQELKEFTSKPPALDASNEGAESQTVSTRAPPAKSAAAAYVVANPGYGKKLKRKKTPQGTLATAASNQAAASVSPVLTPRQQAAVKRTKRSVEDDAEARAEIVDETNIAPPEEFAGDNSQGAFWTETMPRYSAALGVTLPKFMLSRSEHEASFDEAVAGA